MKVIVAGSRKITEQKVVDAAIEQSDFTISEIVCGKAPGVDTLGENYANARNIHVEPFPADWDNLEGSGVIIRKNRWGKLYNANAGFQRNEQMAIYANALIAVWDGKSRGTKDMIDHMNRLGKKVFVFTVTQR